MGITPAQQNAFNDLKQQLTTAKDRRSSIGKQIGTAEKDLPGNSLRDKMVYTDRDTTWGKIAKSASWVGVVGTIGGAVLASKGFGKAAVAKAAGNTRLYNKLDNRAAGWGITAFGSGVTSGIALLTTGFSNDSILNKSPGQKAFHGKHADLYSERAELDKAIPKLQESFHGNIVQQLNGFADELFGKYDHDDDNRIHVGQPDSMVVDERVETGGNAPDDEDENVHTHYGLLKQMDTNSDDYVDRTEIISHLSKFNKDGDGKLDGDYESGEHGSVNSYLEKHKHEIDDYKYFKASDAPE